jgi:CheY-like chemotaxis protein
MANILVIDDDDSLLQMMSIMLKRAGHTPILANSGQDGVQIAQTQHPALAIIDVMMPDMSGYEVCTALRKDSQTTNIPLLMLTALSQPEHRGRAEDAGADAFVTKPVTRDDLIKHVEELLKTGARNFPESLMSGTGAHPPEPSPAVDASGPEPEQPPPPPGFEQSPAAPMTPAAPPPAPYGAPAPAHVALPLVAVMGLSRGAGATTMAVNLALALQQFGRSCIIDLNARTGDVTMHLKRSPRGSWHNLLNMATGSDKRMIGSVLTMDHPSGIGLLAAPGTAVMERLSNQTLHYILTVLGEGFRRIVADLSNDLDATNIFTLNEADHVVLVLGNNAADLTTAMNTLAALEAMRLPGQIHIVMNHARPEGLTYEAAMRAVNHPLAADVPFETAQPQSLVSGMPLMMMQANSLFARTVLHLARQL